MNDILTHICQDVWTCCLCKLEFDINYSCCICHFYVNNGYNFHCEYHTKLKNIMLCRICLPGSCPDLHFRHRGPNQYLYPEIENMT